MSKQKYNFLNKIILVVFFLTFICPRGGWSEADRYLAPSSEVESLQTLIPLLAEADGDNVTCGTICRPGHEGSFQALDEQLKRQYQALRGILKEKGREITGAISTTDADRALVVYAREEFGIEVTVKQLHDFRQQIQRTDPGFRDKQIYFDIPETGTELFWVDNDYAGGHFNQAGNRIHISLPVVLRHKIAAGIVIAQHELAHITKGVHRKKDPGMKLVGAIAKTERPALRKVLRAKKEIEAVIEQVSWGRGSLDDRYLARKKKRFLSLLKGCPPGCIQRLIAPTIIRAFQQGEIFNDTAVLAMHALAPMLDLTDLTAIQVRALIASALNKVDLYYDNTRGKVFPGRLDLLVRLGEKYSASFFPYLRQEINKLLKPEAIFLHDRRAARRLSAIHDKLMFVAALLGRISVPDSGWTLIYLLEQTERKWWWTGNRQYWLRKAIIVSMIKAGNHALLPYILRALDRLEEAGSAIEEIRDFVWWKREEAEAVYGAEYRDFVLELFIKLNSIQQVARAALGNKSKISIRKYVAEMAAVIEPLTRFGRQNPRFFQSALWYLLANDDYPEINHVLIYVISRLGLAEENIEKALIDLANTAGFSLARQEAAIILSNWTCPEFTKDERLRQRARKVLSGLVGEERTIFYDLYGVWIIDRYTREKFTPGELARLMDILNKFPAVHRRARLTRCIIRMEGNAYSERGDNETYLDDDRKHWPPSGSYDYLNRAVRVNETEDLPGLIAHETGHGVHFHFLAAEQQREFSRLHRQSRKRLSLAALGTARGENYRPDRCADDTQLRRESKKIFAYRYGELNELEDLATIYELLMLAVMNEDSDFIERVLRDKLFWEKLLVIIKGSGDGISDFLTGEIARIHDPKHELISEVLGAV